MMTLAKGRSQYGRFSKLTHEQVSSLLFLAYLRGWQDAVKDELAFTTRLQEIARSIGNG